VTAYADVVVVIPGIMGSTLVDREGREIWGLAPGTLVRGLLTLAHGVRQLRLPDGIGDEHPADGVTAGALLPDLHVIPGIWAISVGYSRLVTHLKAAHSLVEFDPAHPERPANLVPFAYDWRLSNRYSAKRLKSVVEPVLARWREQPGCGEAKLVIIGHSMGGLVARWYLDREDGAAHTRSLITLATPHRGAASAVDRLVNGVRKGLGSFAFDLTGVARSLPSLHQLLPEYACVDDGKQLRKLHDTGLPEVSSALVADGIAFHDELDLPVRPDGYDLYPLVGFRHPTATTVRLTGDGARMVRTIDGADEKGDGTVPRLSAVPKGLGSGGGAAQLYADDTHTALPGNKAVLDQIDGILTARRVEHLAPEFPVGVTVDELFVAGEPVTVRAEVEDRTIVVYAQLVDTDTGAILDTARLRPEDDSLAIAFHDVPPGAYQVRVGSGQPPRLRDPVTAATLVADPMALNEAHAAAVAR
jgi:pimeloyl-ACP methyl ester carboxylesterase